MPSHQFSCYPRRTAIKPCAQPIFYPWTFKLKELVGKFPRFLAAITGVVWRF